MLKHQKKHHLHSQKPKVYFKKDGIFIQGRENVDIIFNNNELILRCGKHELNNKLKFNRSTINFIQQKNNVIINNDNDNNTYGSVTNIVANKINLISHEGETRYNVTNPDNLISDEVMLEIIQKNHPLVLGDYLIEFLNLLKDYAVGHVHPYNGMSPDPSEIVKKLVAFDLNKLISKNVTTN